MRIRPLPHFGRDRAHAPAHAQHDPLHGHGGSPRDRAQQAVLQAALHAGTASGRPSKLARLRDRTGRRDEHSEGDRAARRELHQARRLASFARGRRLVRGRFGPARREAQLRHADSARSFEGEAQARRLSPACDSLAGLPAWGFGSRSARAIIIVKECRLSDGLSFEGAEPSFQPIFPRGSSHADYASPDAGLSCSRTHREPVGCCSGSCDEQERREPGPDGA